MTRRSLPLLLGVLLAAQAASADPVFIIEQVVVNVVSAPGGDGERVATVKSGDRLELLERQGEEAHVRLASGAEGWIRTSYLSTEPPLQQRLTEKTAEADKLRQDVSRLEGELATARAAATAAPAAVPADPAAAAGPGNPPRAAAGAEPEATPLLHMPEEPGAPLWEWVLGSTAVALLAGFALGWRTLDRRIRRKYGGLRIY